MPALSSTVTPGAVVTALKDWGCTVRPYQPDGAAWYGHTTPGTFAPVGIMHHHTAGSAALLTSEASIAAMLRLLRVGTVSAARSLTPGERIGTAVAGRQLTDTELSELISEHLAGGFGECQQARAAGIPGPLCHLAPAMIPGTSTAQVHLIGWGNVNHAGMGSSRTLAAVRTGTYAGAAPGSDDVDGNPYFWGLEYLHPGTSLAWPDALLEVGHRAACALCEVMGWSPPSWPGSCIEHREWTARKIDRSWTGDLRSAIATLQEDPMATVDLTPAAIAAVAAAVGKLKTKNLDPVTGEQIGEIAWTTVLSQLERWEDQERGLAPKILTEVKAIAAGLVEARVEITELRGLLAAILAAPGGLTEAQARAVAEAGAQAVLVRLGALAGQA